jgi:ferredoxin--NADP+ reductase
MTPEEIQQLRQKHYNATLIWLRQPHAELRVFRVRPDFPRPPHRPGQYGTLGLGYWEPRVAGCQEEHLAPGEERRLIRRAYSLSCPILDEQGQLVDMEAVDWLEFYIVLVRQAEGSRPPALTPRLFALEEGDRLYLGDKITGRYTTEGVQPQDTVIFLATGTGEAPHNYMIWELLRKGHPGRILSACCVRYRRDLAYREVHETLMRRYPNYTYIALTTREADTIQHKVYIQDLILSGELERRLGQPLDPTHCHVFLCGNPKMIGVPQVDRVTGARIYPKPLGVIEILEQRGFHMDLPAAKIKGNIHFEEFW